MAREFGQIDCELWDNQAFHRLTDDAKLLLLYLRSCQHSNAAGCFVMKVGYLVEDLRWEVPRIDKAFQQLSLHPFALRDPVTLTVFVEENWKRRGPQNPNVAIGAAKSLMALPNSALKARAIEALRQTGCYTSQVDKVVNGWSFKPTQETLPMTLPQLGLGDKPKPHAPAEEDEPEEPKAQRSKSGTRLSEDWTIPDEYGDWARGKGMSESDIIREAKKFLTHFTSDNCKQPVKKNWYQAWQNWVETACERLPKANGHANGNGHSNGSDGPPWGLRMKSWYEKRTWFPHFGPEPGQPGCKVPAEYLAPPP